MPMPPLQVVFVQAIEAFAEFDVSVVGAFVVNVIASGELRDSYCCLPLVALVSPKSKGAIPLLAGRPAAAKERPFRNSSSSGNLAGSGERAERGRLPWQKTEAAATRKSAASGESVGVATISRQAT